MIVRFILSDTWLKAKKKKSHIVTTSSAGYAAIPNSSNFKFTRLSI